MSGGRISPVETLSQTSSNATSNADDLQALQALSGWGTPSLFHITFLPSCSSTILPFIISPILFLSRISLPNAYSETTNLLPERTRLFRINSRIWTDVGQCYRNHLILTQNRMIQKFNWLRIWQNLPGRELVLLLRIQLTMIQETSPVSHLENSLLVLLDSYRRS